MIRLPVRMLLTLQELPDDKKERKSIGSPYYSEYLLFSATFSIIAGLPSVLIVPGTELTTIHCHH